MSTVSLAVEILISNADGCIAFENGSSNLLLNAQGTLTVSFRGNNYGFPVSLWVLQDYPNSAPVAFVTPTRDMFVRPGQHVSAEGRVYHPYLANWRSDVSETETFLDLMMPETTQFKLTLFFL